MKKLQRGMTIVELVVCMGILSLLLLVLTSLFSTSLEVQFRTQASSAVQQDTLYLVSRLQYDVRRASAISLPATIGAQGSTMRLVISGSNWDYQLSGDNLVLVNSLGTHRMNAAETKVTNFQVTKVGNSGGEDQVQINLTVDTLLEGAVGSPSASYSFHVASHL
jgi:prepilin-type N-terminal cleavage/methylation domain-containing protein